MPTVIDHAIAIPTRPANIWEVLKDVSNNPRWHPDSKRVQHLTTLRTGRGMRWRNTTMSDKEQVLEITAWYEGLGYEYRIVDGTNYEKNRGRIRLQEAPEGTVLQWTFSYETSGFLSGIRNSLGMKNHADKEITQGLRNIYTLIKDTKGEDIMSPEESKAYLREAPNVEERASYEPRYPVKVSTQEMSIVTVESDDSIFIPKTQPSKPLAPATDLNIEEPPVTDEDTRPNPGIQEPDTAQLEPSAESSPEPTFLKAMPDAQPTDILPPLDQPVSPETALSPQLEEETVTAPATPAINIEQTSPDSAPDESSPEETRPVAEPLAQGREVTKTDTSTMSVFEVFGLEKPSETEKVRTISTTIDDTSVVEKPGPVVIEEPPRSFMDSTPIIPDIQPEMPQRRRGLRAAMRSRIPRVRLPKSD